ncbi:unnamed protein product [Tetraodon nigroviridis]|uniref:(spotted green pufferfish) hypothetical protein n=1 Tax=Tetraodon nigroviridis TaxID=99883 RepID=Q4RZL3_TETNG|nr:unnamed protein product [Tetraodon nigroviridis]
MVPVPIKARAESRSTSGSSNTDALCLSDQYGSVWSGGLSSGSNYGYHSSNNNNSPGHLSATSIPYQSVPVCGAQNNLVITSPAVYSSSGANAPAGYGVQKNAASSGISKSQVTYSPAFDPEGSAKDFKFVLMEKEKAPDKEAEKLVMNIDSGKEFICSTAADTTKCKYSTNIVTVDENKRGKFLSTIY